MYIQSLHRSCFVVDKGTKTHVNRFVAILKTPIGCSTLKTWSKVLSCLKLLLRQKGTRLNSSSSPSEGLHRFIEVGQCSPEQQPPAASPRRKLWCNCVVRKMLGIIKSGMELFCKTNICVFPQYGFHILKVFDFAFKCKK